jgi:uncharacterized protein
MRHIVALLVLAAGSAAAQQPPLTTVELGVGMHRVRAEVADRDATRALGLMHRTALPPNGGMLFVFDEAGRHCMWMKNTPLPLSVAFIDAEGVVVNIADMQPHTETAHCAARPVPYALEMAQGWFAERGVRAGSRLRGLDKLRSR